jgi:hypothetical protein
MDLNKPILKSIKMFDEYIVEIQYNDNVIVSKKDVAQLYELLDAVTEDRSYAKLLIIGNNTVITEEARVEVTNENKKRKDSILAEAIVVKSLGQRIKTNIYIKFISLYYPTQCFDIQEKAHGWLLKHIKQSRTVK